MCTPIQPRVTLPFSIRMSAIFLARFDGMEKPTPAYWPVCVAIAVFRPITCPSMLTSGPPELPGLIAASVWMKSW